MPPLITICTVNYNSSQFIELMLYAFKKLTKNPYQVIIRDNNSHLDDYKRLERIVATYNNVRMYRVETDLVSSMAHGTALNDLVTQIDTPYGVIIDADATFLLKNWDATLIDLLSDRVPLAGTQADSLGAKPKDFPLMFALLFKTDILKKLAIDFRPKDLALLQDTGWELREKYMAAGYSGAMLYDVNTRFYKEGPFRDIVCSEYYLRSEGERGHIVASHFGRGSAPRAKNLIRMKNGNNPIFKLINKLLMYPNVMKWKHDKKEWLKIGKRIIDTQS